MLRRLGPQRGRISLARDLYVALAMINQHPAHHQFKHNNPDSKVNGANMGPIWGRQDPGGPHVGPMNFAIFELPILEVISK